MAKQTNQEIAIAVLKSEMESVNKHIDKLEKQVEEGFAVLHEKLDKILEQGDEKYASKWVEKFTYVVIMLVITAIVGAVLNLVIIR